MSAPGEIAGWPKLVVRYPTAPEAIAALLPPGLDPCGEPVVTLAVYCAPVHDEPELGVSVKVPAAFRGVEGQYTLGIGIDQESAIFVSRETNGQPKFPCDVRYFRFGDRVEASATHQGHTWLSYEGTIAGVVEPGTEVDDHEWWIKVSRAVGGGEGDYDLPPRVVDVHTTGTVARTEGLDGRLTLRPSPWDPCADLLPPTGEPRAELVATRFTGRTISVAGPLDPEAFWPFADTIGGSRWPGRRGAPRGR